MASQDINNTDTSNRPEKTTPKDALVMAAILKEMGVTEYEPRIINQMVEFAYKYVTDIVADSRVYMTHANRKTINIDDVKLAVSQKLDHSFTSPPPREFLLDIARTKNAQPLPLIQDRSGLRLPPERYCLTGNNYKVKSTTKKTSTQRKTTGTIAASKANMKIGFLPGNVPSQKVNNPTTTQPSTSSNPVTPTTDGISTATDAPTQPNVTTSLESSQFVSSLLKRKREEDDDYDT